MSGEDANERQLGSHTVIKVSAVDVAGVLGPRGNFHAAELDGEIIVRIALVEGKFPAHSHNLDEGWMVIVGALAIEAGDQRCVVVPGDVVTVPANVEHTTQAMLPGTIVVCIHARNFTTRFVDLDPLVGAFRVLTQQELGVHPAASAHTLGIAAPDHGSAGGETA